MRAPETLKDPLPELDPADRRGGLLARWSRTGSLVAGLRRQPREASGLDPEAEKARLARQRQALALAAGVSTALWLALAVGVLFVTREG